MTSDATHRRLIQTKMEERQRIVSASPSMRIGLERCVKAGLLPAETAARAIQALGADADKPAPLPRPPMRPGKRERAAMKNGKGR